MGKIKKSHAKAPLGQIKKSPPHEGRLTFSFALFDGVDSDICAEVFPNGYTRKLIERMQAVSQMTQTEFREAGRSLRSHTHEWAKTSRPNGFERLNEQLRDYPGWQFCLSANEHGRVHGIIIGDVFYVIWLDLRHQLYPGKL